MTETFVAPLLAHALADFVLQPDRMAANKGRPAWLALHIGLVLALAVAATGTWSPWLLWLAAAHLGIDLVKLGWGDRLGPFLADQAAHLASLGMVASTVPALWESGIWARQDLVPPGVLALAILHAAGLILAIRAGAFALRKLLAPLAITDPDGALGQGYPLAGRMIGQLERGLTYLLVMVGQPMGVAFLVAAKSVLRFEATSTDRRAAEYVLIGTLASVGWALVAGYAAMALAGRLDP